MATRLLVDIFIKTSDGFEVEYLGLNREGFHRDVEDRWDWEKEGNCFGLFYRSKYGLKSIYHFNPRKVEIIEKEVEDETG